MTCGDQGEVSITQIIYAILTMVVIGFILVLVLKIDLSKYFSFLPSFGNPEEDKLISNSGDVEFSSSFIEKTDFKFGGGKSGGAGVSRPFDTKQYSLLEVPVPDPISFVSDYAGVLSDKDENRLDSILSLYEKETSNEIAIVSLTSMEEGSKQVTREIFDKWGIGKKDKDNGVLIVFSSASDTVRIEVGYGLEGQLTDFKVGTLLDTYLVGKLDKKNLPQSLENIINAIKEILVLP